MRGLNIFYQGHPEAVFNPRVFLFFYIFTKAAVL